MCLSGEPTRRVSLYNYAATTVNRGSDVLRSIAALSPRFASALGSDTRLTLAVNGVVVESPTCKLHDERWVHVPVDMLQVSAGNRACCCPLLLFLLFITSKARKTNQRTRQECESRCFISPTNTIVFNRGSGCSTCFCCHLYFLSTSPNAGAVSSVPLHEPSPRLLHSHSSSVSLP